MPRKNTSSHRAESDLPPAEINEQPITETITKNFMPYAMSVIMSRAIPEIDGLKPSHRKLLYTMYKMGLLTGSLTKSANICGQTMQLNPHGDAAIYDTLVRLSRGNGALLHPLIESKGNFGRVYSRDMACAAPRYTESKLAPICTEFFRDIDCDAVDFVPNYDNTQQEPTLLPTTFPNILVAPNQGIAVGMASMICSFNLAEVCATTAALIKNPHHDLLSTLIAPDFSTGGLLLYDRSALEDIYNTGRGSVRVRAKWRAEGNIIEITELPYTTTVEAVIDKCAELIKAGKLKEVSDIRDETDLSGLKLAIDLKRGQDPQKFMRKLFRMTTLEDSFSCNFNILISGTPRVMGVREILTEWIAWRTECVKRRIFFDLNRKKDRLHLLEGLEKILLDIDRAIAIIRHTENEEDVVPNLMTGFGIDEIQAEYVAEIKLRNINREYILKRTAEIDDLKKEIARLEETVKSKAKLQTVIVSELNAVSKKYGQPRRTMLLESVDEPEEEDETPQYSVHVFLTRDGYFKKITAQSLRMSDDQKLKEGDALVWHSETTSNAEIIFLTDRQFAYKARLSEFDDTKASTFGDFIPSKLSFEDGERVIMAFLPEDYAGSLLFVFENGHAARVPMRSYETKSNRRRLSGAYSDLSPLVAAFPFSEESEFALYATNGKLLLLNTALLAPKASRDTQGVAVMRFAAKYHVERACTFEDARLANPKLYRAKSLPSAGSSMKPEDAGQMTLG